jgi:hypothetical protein
MPGQTAVCKKVHEKKAVCQAPCTQTEHCRVTRGYTGRGGKDASLQWEMQSNTISGEKCKKRKHASEQKKRKRNEAVNIQTG